jgi:hypothetical protein
MVAIDSRPVLSLTDRYGASLAEFYYLSAGAIIYVHWHGNLTAAEVIRGVEEGSKLLAIYPFVRVLNDKRDTTGDWSEALPWLQYEWLPQAVAGGIRAIAYLLSPDLESQIVSQDFVDAVSPQVHVSLFLHEEPARLWLYEH